MTARPAVLFDVDGTLVDSNYLHVHAWQRSFAEVGIDVAAWRIHRSIGMDGATLVASLSGNAPENTQQQLTDLHSHYYRDDVALLRPLPGAQQLLERVAALGLQVVLATSAPEDELDTLRKVLNRDGLISTVTSSVDVDSAKPNPDIVGVALERAGVCAAEAVFVGDTVWDAKASARAGLANIGLLSGGIAHDELKTAGATPVFENPEDLLNHLTETPIAALARR